MRGRQSHPACVFVILFEVQAISTFSCLSPIFLSYMLRATHSRADELKGGARVSICGSHARACLAQPSRIHHDSTFGHIFRRYVSRPRCVNQPALVGPFNVTKQFWEAMLERKATSSRRVHPSRRGHPSQRVAMRVGHLCGCVSGGVWSTSAP